MRQRIVLQPVKKPTGRDTKSCVKDQVRRVLSIMRQSRQSLSSSSISQSFNRSISNTNMPESAEMFFDSIKPSSIQDWGPDKSIRKQ